MARLRHACVFGVLFAVVAQTAAFAQSAERTFALDGRTMTVRATGLTDWSFGQSIEAADRSSMWLVPRGQSVESWREGFSITEVASVALGVPELDELLRSDMPAACRGRVSSQVGTATLGGLLGVVRVLDCTTIGASAQPVVFAILARNENSTLIARYAAFFAPTASNGNALGAEGMRAASLLFAKIRVCKRSDASCG